MTNLSKVIIIIVVMAGCFCAGYFIMPSKVVTVTKEKQVVKYLKADRIEYKPDGSATAFNVNSGSTTNESEYSKTEINAKKNLLMFSIPLTQRIDSFTIHYGRDIWGSAGIAIGTDYSWKEGQPKQFRALVSGYAKF